MGGDETGPGRESSRRPRRAPAPKRSHHDEALRSLARAPRTALEIRRLLESRGAAGAEIERVLARLSALGYIDDEKLALDYLQTRASRSTARAPQRLAEELARRGVAAATVRAALAASGLDPIELLRKETLRRIARERRPLDRRGAARVYTALLRAGFEGDAARAEIERQLSGSEHDERFAGGIDDDLP